MPVVTAQRAQRAISMDLVEAEEALEQILLALVRGATEDKVQLKFFGPN